MFVTSPRARHSGSCAPRRPGWQGDEEAPCPEKRIAHGMVGAKPQPSHLRIPLRNQGLRNHGPSVPFRKFDEEVLRTLRGLWPHPLPPRLGSRAHARGSPPGLDDQAADTAVSGGEGEDLTEAGGRRPPASFKTSPLPRLDSLLGTLTRAPGRPSAHLHCAARSAAQVSLRAAARGSGVGVEDDHGRSACSRGAAVKLHVEITSHSKSTNL